MSINSTLLVISQSLGTRAVLVFKSLGIQCFLLVLAYFCKNGLGTYHTNSWWRMEILTTSFVADREKLVL